MKKITSLSLGLSFIVMSYTGIMLFICPHGKVAYWNDWHFLGLSKSQYGELHTTSMIIMLLFGSLHIYYNWKAIVSYMKDRARKVSFTKKEFLIAFGINALFLVGTLSMVQPFKAFLDFEEGLKDSWSVKYGKPPYGHAEQSRLKMFCKKVDIDLNYAKEQLNRSGIVFKESDTLLTIAKANGLTPSKLYEIIKKGLPSAENGVSKSNKK